MQTTLGCPGLLFQLVTLLTISFTAGLNCTSCIDVKSVKILKNTVPGLTFRANSNTPSSPQCKTAVNGDDVSGIDVTVCGDDSSNSSKEYRCVLYSGQVKTTVFLVLGESSGEVSISYEGTYRGCMFINDKSSGSCVNENALLPEGNELRRGILEIVPFERNSTSVVFQGQKCVSDVNGTFLSGVGEPSIAAVKKSCVYLAYLFLFVYFFVLNEMK